MTPVDYAAAHMADAYFEAITPPDRTRWISASVEQRRTFVACAEAAFAAGRANPGLEPAALETAVAQAVAGAFWRDATRPPPAWLTWAAGPPQVRDLFRQVARAGISGARRWRELQREAA